MEQLFISIVILATEIRGHYARETESAEDLTYSLHGLGVGMQTLLYIVIASLCVLLVGFMLYCITCIKGPGKEQRRARQSKPSTIVIRPAIRKSNQQNYQQRVVRPVEKPTQAAPEDDYETHSLTMYIPEED